MPAGSSRALRLDPFALPVRFAASDAAADGRVRQIELDRERVVLRRAVRGMRMEVSMPVAAFPGVAMRMLPAEGESRPPSPSCSNTAIPRSRCRCSSAAEGDDAVAEWKAWGRVLGVPLLVAEGDGALREPFAASGGVRIERVRAAPAPPQRASSGGGPRSCCAARPAGHRRDAVHRGEREIIARN